MDIIGTEELDDDADQENWVAPVLETVLPSAGEPSDTFNVPLLLSPLFFLQADIMDIVTKTPNKVKKILFI